MSYTPPAGNAADFSWAGAAAYVAPAGGAADLSFLVASPAAGFSSTAFGSPVSSSLYAAQASGLSSTAFGTSIKQGAPVTDASGSSTTALGVPSSRMTTHATGTSQTLLGSPNAAVAYSSTGFLTAVFGVPSVTHAAAGVTPGRVGTPSALLMASPVTSYAPSTIVWDDFETGTTSGRSYQTPTGAVPWGAVTGTVAGGLLNPTVGPDWPVDRATLEFSPASAAMTAGRYFDLSVTVKAVNRVGGEFSANAQKVELYLVQGSGSGWYNLDFISVRGSTGGEVYLSEFDDVISNEASSIDAGRTEYATGTSHVYRMVSRPGAIELFEDGVLLQSLTIQSATRQRGAFVDTAYIKADGFAIDAIDLTDPDGVQTGLAQFGAPSRGVACAAVSIGRTTNISPAYYSFAQWEEASAVQPASRFGTPGALQPTPTSTTTAARGATSSIFSVAATSTAVSGSAQGVAVPTVGTPTLRTSYAAANWQAAALGSPFISLGAVTAGWAASVMPTPSHARSQSCTGFERTKFSNPRSDILGTQKAVGTPAAARFGRPACRTGDFRLVVGFATGSFGSAAASSIYRARHTAPTVRFAKALLRRSPTC
jgi:hypothetical protein